MTRRLKYEALEERVVMSASSPAADPVTWATVGQDAVASLTPPLAAALPIDQWVKSLVYQQFDQLLPEHVPYLTLQQVASIPDGYWLSRIIPESRAAFSTPQIQALNVRTVGLSMLTPQQVGWLTIAQIQSLTLYNFQYLSASQTPLLTPAQIATIPDPGPFAEWTPAARAALTQVQIQALRVGTVRLTMLTPQQVSWLTVAQIQTLTLHDFQYLSASQAPWLTPAQIATIPDPGPFAEWTPGARAALTQPQIQALNVRTVGLSMLTPQQVGWLTIAQIQSLTLYNFQYLSASQTPLLTPAQIATIPDPGPFAEWTPAARAALTQPQIQALNVGTVGLSMLTPQQVGWLTIAQIQSLTLYDFKYLHAGQIPTLTPAQVATIPNPGPLATWSVAARAALTQPQIQALNVRMVRVTMLTSQQIGWLTVAQIQSLQWEDIKYLSMSQREHLLAVQVGAMSYADFRFLPASKIPLLATAQIASIPDAASLAQWPPAARAALTSQQIPYLNVRTTGLSLLTPSQIVWLKRYQIQSLQRHDFGLLHAYQIPHLTPTQIASMPDGGLFSTWSPAARAALTQTQVTALRVSTVHLGLLTSTQVGWLTVSQIQSLSLYDFKYLLPSQTPLLTPAQISTIPDPGPFAEWTAAARAALTPPQIQALRVDSVGLGLLTSQQLGWLTTAQIRSLGLHDFKYLAPYQVPLLTAAQIASIPNPGPLAEWTAEARAALTYPQILALNVSEVRLTLLTATQVAWLSPVQISSLRWEDIKFLHAFQVQYLTPAQFAAIPDGGFLRGLADEVKAQFSRAQLLALSPQMMFEYGPTAVISPTNYVPTVDIPMVDGMPASHLAHLETQRVADLVPLAAATHSTVASGNWSDPNVWKDRRIPTTGARVLIAAGDTVRFDAYRIASAAIHTLRVDGTLTFSTTSNTQLAVDTVVVTQSGKLHLGTSAARVEDHVTARILITGGPINTTWDPYLLSRGVISYGEVRMYGEYVTPYLSIAAPLLRGATQLPLSSVPVNWQVGDEIVLTGTQQHLAGNQSERLTIRAISGSTVTVDPLQFDHVPPQGFGLSLYAANFSRNVELTAANDSNVAERPHLMFLHNPNVVVENVSITGFGRTDKSVPISDPVVVNGALQPGTGLNPRARYAMHFHHTGVNPAYPPAVVRGSVINGSPGWGFVNHSSNVVMENNVAYEAFGAGFSAEDGNEIGVMRNNLSMNSYGSGERLQSREHNHDFGHGGHGFWFQGPGVAVVGNISAGNGDSAFAYFTNTTKVLFDAVNLDDPALAAGRKAVAVGLVPLKQFSGNVAMTSRSGLEIWFHQSRMNDGKTLIDNFTAWNLRYTGIDLRYTAQTTVRNGVLVGDMGVFRGYGVNSNHITGDITFENMRIEGFETGLVAPAMRSNAIRGGTFNNLRSIYIAGPNDTIRTLTIEGALEFKSATALQLNNRTQYSIYADAEPDFLRGSFPAMLAPTRITYAPDGWPHATLWFAEQVSGYVPFSSLTATGLAPAEYLDLTNEQLRALYGISLGGGLPPADVVLLPGIRALIDLTPGS